MSRIDRHISWVQGKLAGQRFLDALAVAAIAFCALVLAAVLVARSVQLHPPRPMELSAAIAAAAVVAAGVWAMFRRPTPMQAAIAIDRQLGLKEKFSTALQFRTSSDPFAAAAVRDARTSQGGGAQSRGSGDIAKRGPDSGKGPTPPGSIRTARRRSVHAISQAGR